MTPGVRLITVRVLPLPGREDSFDSTEAQKDLTARLEHAVEQHPNFVCGEITFGEATEG